MKIRIGSSRNGILTDGDCQRLEIVEQDGDIRVYADGKQVSCCKEKYIVARIGEIRKEDDPVHLSRKGMPTTWDLVDDFDGAVKKIQEAGYSTEKIYFCLPGEAPWSVHYHGPLPIEKAREICAEYWNEKYANKQNCELMGVKEYD